MNQQEINSQSMLRVGTILHGTYRIDSYLSSGGFGNTYIATNIEFDERVAIKEFFMKGVTQRDGNQTTVSVSNSENTNSFIEQREKFKKEARRIRQLHNEHIVAVHDLFEENGTAYYVMDYVDGENLAERLKCAGRPMTEPEVNQILPQILDALKAVHDAGFCHLDIKPSNIMLEKGCKVKLIDFGASKQLGANGTLTTNAPTAFAQTPGYAPREQIEQSLSKIGPWTDIYALGATLYNLLTNKRPPLPSDIDDDMSEDKHEALSLPLNISDNMKKHILWFMQTNRLKRPQTIDDIDMSDIISNRTISPIVNGVSADLIKTAEEETLLTVRNDNHDIKSKLVKDVENCQRPNKVGESVINYLVHPLKHYIVSFLALLIIFCVLAHQIPEIFYTFGEYNIVFGTFTIGSWHLETFSPLVIAAQYLFYVFSICITIPFIIGIWPFSKLISYLMILSQLLVVSKLIENHLVTEGTILNWVLFYGHLLLYWVCGTLMVNIYKGRVVLLGKIFILYSFLCIALNIPYNLGVTFDTNLHYFIYESFVWGIDIIWVCGMWWMLTRKEAVNESN